MEGFATEHLSTRELTFYWKRNKEYMIDDQMQYIDSGAKYDRSICYNSP